MVDLPAATTPLYNHGLPQIEFWLTQKGCVQNRTNLHCWQFERPAWEAEICLDIEELMVRYHDRQGGDTVQRSFKYSLSRQDIEAAIFAGP
ncbi:DUF3143 domain-containing protein [Candidatus Synechococcus calcipolaris G9]|uniref:DUF3143 domain-containing protein n=1 Tax=Candidatus Synechococcus calcipolaris G9 TaxID=1497997 RepID=A0ABT6EZM6_9SYNE|nr:DUF3143 domain-containing protein [Candidatus Synechococcus calcipolaris]MDG2991028.1 DUF3143 domain-containing protein [Candidatus Synechococcus calcipolaris G9]